MFLVSKSLFVRGLFARALFVTLVLVCPRPAGAQPTKANDVRKPPESNVLLAPGSVPGCTLEQVTDVRTLSVRIDSSERTVRLIGIEPVASDPELRKLAASFLENALRGESLTIVVPDGVGVDREARPQVIVRREPEGLDIGLELVRQGFAALDPKFDELAASLPPRQVEQYRQSSARAKELKKGLWSTSLRAPRPVPLTENAKPSEISKPDDGTGPSAAPTGALGVDQVFITPSGKKYHREGCKFLSKAAKPMSIEEAKKKYEPCSSCYSRK